MTIFVRTKLAVLVLLLTALFNPYSAQARETRRGFNLFVPAANVLLRGNRAQCNINNLGEHCVDPNNSPANGGGFWPRGTGDQYIFNGGINFSALILGAPQTGFPWPGDTVGAFFFDQRGDQQHSEALTPVADGLSSHDWLRWPSAGRATDPAIFAPALLGRRTISDQDSWTRYWDGGTGQDRGRKHPAGVMVDQRTMSFDTPGLEDVVFVIYRLVNVTSRNAADYQQLAAVGYGPDDVAEIAALGATFQDRMEHKYQIQIPDGGYPLDSLFVSYEEDSDVGPAGSNSSSLNLVFSSGFAWVPFFSVPTWQYPADVFAPPFAQAPGFVANAFLRTPPALPPGAPRIWLSGTFSGGAPFPSAFGTSRLWRNSSGNFLPTDGTCSVASPKTRHFCYMAQVPHDTRYYMSTGPSRLAPGGSIVLIAAHVFAAALEAPILPYIGVCCALAGGFPVEGSRLVNGLDTLRVIDRAAGWVSHSDVNGNGAIDANEVLTTPRSLYAKIQAAQAAVDRGFVMPAPPAAPEFFPVAGDHHVTIAWQKSATETAGDPYFAVAADPTSPLYDPDYRSNDVEGYRVWRGTSVDNMQVIAQFDYRGTAFQDYTGQVVYGTACAPELGVTTSCPPFPASYALGLYNFSNPPLIQVRLGDRVRLSNGAVAVLRTDTAVTGGASGRAALQDTGMPFLFVDSTAQNGRSYLYSVTAFDVNSVRSGRSTLESPATLKSATPRVPSGNSQAAVVVVGMFGSDGETELDPTAPFPAIDSATGTFRGLFPPADGATFTFAVSLPEVMAAGDYTARIDSVSEGGPQSITGTQPNVFMTLSAPGFSMPLSYPVLLPSHGDVPWLTTTYSTTLPLVPYDSALAAAAGIPPSFSSSARMLVDFSSVFEPISGGPPATMLCGRGLITAANCGGGAIVQASRYLLHSRWYDEGAAEPPDPTLTFNPSADHNSGKLSLVTSIWNPMPYRVPLGAGGATRVTALFRYFPYGMGVFYPADFVVTWGSGGLVTVRDSTHRTNLPPATGLGAGYGFINGAAIAAAGVTTAMLQFGGQELGAPNPAVPSYHSLYTVRPICNKNMVTAGVGAVPCANLSPTAVLQGLDLSNPADGVPDASGIVLVINGEPFFMTLGAVPPAGTRWHLKAVGGLGMTATCTPTLGTAVAEFVTPPIDCLNYSYIPPNPVRPALAPGLQFKIRVTQSYAVAGAATDLKAVHTVPDPYYYANSLEAGTGRQVLRFVNLPDRAIIRIYSAAGALTAIVNHNDATGGGEASWDLVSRGGRPVASGVYFFHVESPDGQTRVGRFVVVNGER